MPSGDTEWRARRARATSTRPARSRSTKTFESVPSSLTFSAYTALYLGDVDRASDLHTQVLAICRAHGDLWGMGIVLFDLALLRRNVLLVLQRLILDRIDPDL